MDGTYGNALPPGSAPMSPSTPSPSNNLYKTNVNRSKTRKWVEAKMQSYDGDDWGADYDEPEVPPALPPPAKPMGPRQVSGPPPPMRPFQPDDSPAASPGLRSPSGPPTLHIQTHSPQTSTATTPRQGQYEPDSPWHTSSAAQRIGGDRVSTEQVSQVPQSAATASSVYSGGGTSSHASPPPQSTGPVPSRFPPRKSSMSSQQDAVDYADSIRQPAPALESTSQNPVGAPRTASPASAKSPLSPNKPLPFIRPADIYRRMEEEKDKERRSMDSGRPSLDSIGARGSGVGSAIGSPSLQQIPQPSLPDTAAKQSWRTSVGPEELSTSPKPALTPVAERKSEYGLEGLIDSYGLEEGVAEQIPAPSKQAQAQVSDTTSEHGQSIQPEDASSSPMEKDMRRFSTSPKLPDFARMSGFGEDLFATSPRPFMPDTPSMPSISDEASKPALTQRKPLHTESAAVAEEPESVPMEPANKSPLTPTAQSKPSAPVSVIESTPVGAAPHVPVGSNLGIVHQLAEDRSAFPLAQSPVERPGASPSHSETDPLETAPVADHSDWQQVAGADVPRPEGNQETETLRPTLPGGWVSETPTTPGEAAAVAPGHLHTESPPVAVKSDDTSEISPVTETDESGEESGITGKQGPGFDGDKGVADAFKSGVEVTSTSPTLTAVPALPPLPSLQTSSSAAAPPLETEPTGLSTTAAGKMPEPNAVQGSKDEEPTTPVPDSSISTSAPSDITPIAPLNPRKDALDVDLSKEVLAIQPSLERASTIDTNTSSPVKESDMLREEIIKSLSPVPASPSHQSNEFFPIGASGSALALGAEEPVRESTYLGDVYGDYWTASDDKPEQEGPAPASQIDLDKAPEPAAQPESTRQDARTAIHEASPQGETTPQGRRRFSWEAASEEPVEPKSLSREPDTAEVRTPASESTSGAEPEEASERDKSRLAPSTPKPDAVLPVEEGKPPISHQASQVSTIPPRSGSAALIEPPSPVSVLSEPAPAALENHRLSLADEKGLAQSSLALVSPSPPQDQHPALGDRPSEATATTAGPLTIPGSTQPINILPFRQILDMPSPADRIKLYRETRQQFAAMDTGLDDWLASMRARHREHANATSSFDATFAYLPADVPAGGTPGSPQGAPQPYYQQYLNASSTGIGSQGGRPAGNIPMPPAHLQGTSSFGHTSNQVGVKSKEFLMAAGKAGKGLLSKGKNKLRNTGDKDVESPPAQAATQTSTKPNNKAAAERRRSWGIGFVSRLSRAGLHLDRTDQGDAVGPRAKAPNRSNLGISAQEPVGSARSLLKLHGQHQPQRNQRQSLDSQLPLLSRLHRTQFQQLEQFQRPQDPQKPSAVSSSPPPQLPTPTRISPFNSLSHGGHSSPFDRPPQTPPVDASAIAAAPITTAFPQPRASQPDELVSPVSDSLSSSRPTPAPQRQLEAAAGELHVPPPISKQQPSWDPFTGTPLVEEEGFDFDFDEPTPHGPRVAELEPAASAHALAADNRCNDGRYVVPPQRDITAGGLASPPSPSQLPKASAQQRKFGPRMAAYAQNPNLQPAGNFPHQLQQPPQHHYPQQQGNMNDPSAPHRQSSFGLPPVKRTSTWGSSIMKSIEGVSGDNGDASSSFAQQPAHAPTSSPSPGPTGAWASALPQPQGQQQFEVGPQSHQMMVGQGQGPFNQFLPNGQPQQQPMQQQQFIPGGYRPSQPMMQGQQQQQQQPQMPPQQQQQSQPFYGQGLQQQPQAQQTQGFPGAQGQFFSQGQANGQPAPPRGYASPSGQQQIIANGAGRGQNLQWVPQGTRPDETVSPATGNPVQQFPPQGNPIQRLPPQGPQGAWNLQESHLTKPLIAANRNRTSSSASQQPQPFYGFDKETGGGGTEPGGRFMSPEPQPSMAGQHTGSPQQQAQGGQAGPSSSQNPSSQAPASQAPGGFVARSFTHQTNESSPSSDQSASKRVSSLFGGLRQKITGGGSDDRRENAGGVRVGPPGGPVRPPGGPVGLPSGHLGPPGGPVGAPSGPVGPPGGPAGPPGGPASVQGAPASPPVGPDGASQAQTVTGDGVSEASVVTHETTEQRKRGSFFPLRSSGQKTSDNDSIIAQSPGTPVPSPPPQFSPPEKKPTFFNSITSRTPKTSTSDVPRPSMSMNAPPVTNAPGQPPKKRFSALKDVFSRPGVPQDQGQPPPQSVHSAISSSQFQGQSQQPPFASPAQPGLMGPSSTAGRDRSDSNANPRPFTAGSTPQGLPQHLQAGAPADSERGRKPSAGGFLGFLKNRSDSKTREPTVQQGAMMTPAGQQLAPQPRPGQQGQPQFRSQQPLTGQQPGQFTPQPGQQAGQGQLLGQRMAPGQQQPPMQGQYPGPRPFMPLQQPSQPGQQQQWSQQSVIPGPQPQSQSQGQQRQPQFPVPQSGFPQNQQPNGQAMGQMPQGLSPQQQQALVQQEFNQRAGQQTPGSAVGSGTAQSQAGSPQVGSPVSQNSRTQSMSPADQMRQQNDSPVSFRQAPPSQQVSPSVGPQVQTHRQSIPGTIAPAPGQTPIRKPVPSPSPKLGDQLRSQESAGDAQEAERTASFSSLQQSPKLAPHEPPVPDSVEQTRRTSGPSLGTQSPLGSHPFQPNQSPLQRSQAQQQVSPAPTPSPQATRQSPLAGPPQQTQGLGLVQAPPSQQLARQQQGPQSGLQPGQQPPQQFNNQQQQPGQQFGQQQPAQQNGQQTSRPVGGQQQQGTPTPSGQPFAPPQAQFMLSRTTTNQSGPQQTTQKEQSTMSKFFKGITSSQPSAATQQGQDKPEKEKKSFMSSILRGSKQPQPQQSPLVDQKQFPQNQFVQGQFPQGPPPGMAPQQRQQGPPQLQGQPQGPLGPRHPGGSIPQGQGGPTPLQQRQLPHTASPGPNPGPLGPQPLPPQGQQIGSTTQSPATTQPSQQPLQGPPGQVTPQGQSRIQNLQRQISGTGALPPAGSAEPQYAQVPIPQGYSYVHGEGRVAPSPYWAGRPPYYGPQSGQFAPQQQWGPNGMVTMQPLPGFVPGHAQGIAQGSSQGQPQGLPPPGTQGPAPGVKGPQAVHQLVQAQGTRPQVQGQSPPLAGQQLIGQPPQGQQPIVMQQQPGNTLQSPAPAQAAARAPPVVPLHQQQVQAQLPLQAAAQISPQSGLSSISSPGQPVQPSVSPVSQPQSRQEPGMATVSTAQRGMSPPPQLRHPASPQSYPLPNSAFSPINPTADNLPNPPLPNNLGRALSAQAQETLDLVPQRQISAVSQMSVQPSSEPQAQFVHQPVVLPSGHVGSQSSNPSLSPQITPERTVSPEPPNETAEAAPPAQDERAVSPPPASISTPPTNIIVEHPVQNAENIYDATPRTSVVIPHRSDMADNVIVAPAEANRETASSEPKLAPAPQEITREQVAEAKPQGNIVVESAPPVVQPAPQSVSQVIMQPSTSNGNVSPPKSTSADIFEEAKRKMLLREQEEKIPVFPTEPDLEAAAAQAAKKKVQEEQPQMSATSYPGQEWNPYGDGFDNWDD